MADKIIQKKIFINGRVQGVAFRKYANQSAKKMGIAGFVKNQDDGSVYIEAEGQKEDLDLFIEWCHKGSPFSKVESVDIKDGAPYNYTSFDIIFD